jgi:Predicted membrane protein (DUF2231)
MDHDDLIPAARCADRFNVPSSRGAEGAVAILPWGIILSFITVGLMLFTGWKGWAMVYRYRVAVADELQPQTPRYPESIPRRAAE